MTDTEPDTSARVAALERAMIRNDALLATPLERAREAALPEIVDRAAEALSFDFQRNELVDKTAGEPTTVQQWLAGQRESKPAWFRPADEPAKPETPRVPGAVTHDTPPPPVPGTPHKPKPAPLGKRYVEMSSREFEDYRKQNRYARVASSKNSARTGERVLVVDTGAAAAPGDIEGMSLADYKEWRKSVGMRNGYEGVAR